MKIVIVSISESHHTVSVVRSNFSAMSLLALRHRRRLESADMGQPAEEKIGFFGARKRAQELQLQERALIANLAACNAEVHRQTAISQGLTSEINRLGSMTHDQIRQDLNARRSEGARISADLDRDIANMRGELASLTVKVNLSRAELADINRSIVDTTDLQALQTVGVYDYTHPLDDSVQYKSELTSLQDRIKTAVRGKSAITASTTWTINNSLAQGRKLIDEIAKLMLRAYNAEADNLIRTMKPFKLANAVERLGKTKGTIERLGKTLNIRVSDQYHELRVRELQLTADYLNKVAEEKEAAREERARLAEERRAQVEIERERRRLEKERQHVQNALAALHAQHDDLDGIAQLEEQLADVQRAMDEVNYRAANVRAGYVYVISNIGALGERMVKIGMTRRLDPRDRVTELGDASVPFRFDTHALFFSEDAVTIEAKLHKAFAERRVNLVNPRREFFYATPLEVRDVLTTLTGALVHYSDSAPAAEYRQSHNERLHITKDAVAESSGT